jgi:hypothetical protein
MHHHFNYTKHFPPSLWQVTGARSIKRFILTSQPVPYTTFDFVICLKSVLLGAPSLVQTNDIHRGCKEGSSWFLSPLLPLLPLLNIRYVDEHCQAVGWSSLTVSQSLLLNRLVHIIAKQVTVILCINPYTMQKKINMNHSFGIPKHTCHDTVSCVLNLLDGDQLWHPCWIVLTLEQRSNASTPRHRSLFSLGFWWYSAVLH